jgi:hypothetical protein
MPESNVFFLGQMELLCRIRARASIVRALSPFRHFLPNYIGIVAVTIVGAGIFILGCVGSWGSTGAMWFIRNVEMNYQLPTLLYHGS